MSARDLMIAHGEKLALVLIAGFASWQVYSVYTNSDLRPGTEKNELSKQKIQDDIDYVKKRRADLSVPKLEPPPPFLEQLQARMGVKIEAGELPAFLTVHPDLPPVTERTVFPYLYQVLPVEVAATDRLGAVELLFAMPESKDVDATKRYSDAPVATWKRNDRGIIINKAQREAIQVEVSAGDKPWRPVQGAGVSKDGIIPLAQLKKDKDGRLKLKLEDVETWSEHKFRTRLIVRATGMPLPPTEEVLKGGVPGSILVYPGRYADDDKPEKKDLNTWHQWLRDKPAFVQKFLTGSTEVQVPGTALVKGERYYFSEPTVSEPVMVTSKLRFVLKAGRRDANANEGGTEHKATILLTALIEKDGAKDGEGSLWLKKPITYNLKVGDTLGKSETPPSPFDDRAIAVDLTTPFVVTAVEDVRRVLYWEVKVKSRTGGGKELSYVGKEQKSVEVTLTNPKTGQVVKLTPLLNIPPPAGKSFAIYPKQMGEGCNEEAIFLKDPPSFRSFGVRPIEPKTWEKDQGPLPKLAESIAKRNPAIATRYTTDTTYLELADGRIIYYSPVLKEVQVWPEEKEKPKPVEPPKQAEPANPPVGGTPPPVPVQPKNHQGPTPPPGKTTPTRPR